MAKLTWVPILGPDASDSVSEEASNLLSMHLPLAAARCA